MKFKSSVLRGHNGPVYALTSCNNYLYSSAGDSMIARWDLSTNEIDSFSVKLDAPAYTICSTNDILFAGCTNGTVIAIDTENKSLLWETNYLGFPIFSLVWSEGLNALLVGDAEGNLFAFSKEGNRNWHFPLGIGKIRAMACADSNFYVGAQDGIVRCFDNLTLNEIWNVQAHQGSIYTILRTEVGLLTGGMDGHMAHLSYVGEKINALPIHYQSVYGLIQLGDYFVSCSKDKTIKVWNNNWQCVQRIEVNEGHKRSVNALVVANGKFVSGGDDKLVIVWE